MAEHSDRQYASLEMMNTRSGLTTVRYGYLADFADPTFLFIGNKASLLTLKDMLRSLPQRKIIALEDDPAFSSFSDKKLVFRLVDTDEGMRLIENDLFEWRLTPEQSIKFSDKVQGVLNNDKPCHDYLDSTRDDAVVVVSKDEYPETWPTDTAIRGQARNKK